MTSPNDIDELRQLVKDATGHELSLTKTQECGPCLRTLISNLNILRAWEGRLGAEEPVLVHQVPEV